MRTEPRSETGSTLEPRLVQAAGAPTDGSAPRSYAQAEVATIVRWAADGDRGAWEALVSRYVSLVWAVALQHGLGEADAADVAQSTWLRLLEHIDEIREPSRVGAWLATTARREALRVIAMRRRLVLEADDENFDGPDIFLPDADERLISEETGKDVREALSALPPSWQALVRLLMLDPPLSYQQIGDQLGLPVGSIGPTRGRCISRMRAALEAI